MYLNFFGFMAECILDRTKTYEDFIANPEMWLAQEYKGERYRYTHQEMEGLWGCIRSERERVDKLESWGIVKESEIYKDFDLTGIDL